MKTHEENRKNEDQNQNKKPANAPDKNTPDTRVTEGLDDINAASGDSQDNVVSSAHSKAANERHGRKRGEPITGATPKGV